MYEVLYVYIGVVYVYSALQLDILTKVKTFQGP